MCLSHRICRDNSFRDNWFQLQGHVLVFKAMSQVSQDKCNSRHPNSPLVHLIANGLPRVIQNLEVGGISVTDKPLLCPWRRHWPRLCCDLCSAPMASGEPCLGFLKEGQNCKYFQGLFGKLVSYREELFPPLFSAVMLSEGSLHPHHCAYLGRGEVLWGWGLGLWGKNAIKVDNRVQGLCFYGTQVP